MKEWTFAGRKISLTEGNIALLETEAIVNAANKSLILGGGVAGAIRNFGGPTIQEECNRIGPIKVGEAALTQAGNLKAKFVIHAAGPVYGEGDEEDKLEKATLNSLKIATQKQIIDMTFPAISTGIFGFPLQKCSEIMLNTAMDYIQNHEFPHEIVFCLYQKEDLLVFENTLTELVSKIEARDL